MTEDTTNEQSQQAGREVLLRVPTIQIKVKKVEHKGEKTLHNDILHPLC